MLKVTDGNRKQCSLTAITASGTISEILPLLQCTLAFTWPKAVHDVGLLNWTEEHKRV